MLSVSLSNQNKSNRSAEGKRPGAGRKPNLVKHLLKGVTRDTIAAAVQDIDVGGVIAGLLNSRRELVRLQTLNFIFDRLQGKPKQDVNVSGAMLPAHARDPMLAALPKEALDTLARAYDDVLTRYAVLDAAQDGRQNQNRIKASDWLTRRDRRG